MLSRTGDHARNWEISALVCDEAARWISFVEGAVSMCS